MLPGNDNTVIIMPDSGFKFKSSKFLNSVAAKLATWAAALDRRAVSIEFGHGVLDSLFRPHSMPVQQLDLLGNPELAIDPAPVDLSVAIKGMVSVPGLREAVLRGYTRKKRSEREIKMSMPLVKKVALPSEVGGHDDTEIDIK